MAPEATTTQEIVEKDKRHHVHPYQVFDVFAEEGALPIASGDGAYLTDSDGKRYLDAVGGLWCNNIGQGREDMVEAIAEQVRRLSYSSPFTDLTHAPAANLAARLADLAPGDLNHVFFSTGGSTANDVAYRLVQFYQNVRGKPEKRHFLSRVDAYHGQTYAAVSGSASSSSWTTSITSLRPTSTATAEDRRRRTSQTNCLPNSRPRSMSWADPGLLRGSSPSR